MHWHYCGRWWWDILILPCQFSLNNSETVTTVNLAFNSIKFLFIRDLHAKFSISNSLKHHETWTTNSIWQGKYNIVRKKLTKTPCWQRRQGHCHFSYYGLFGAIRIPGAWSIVLNLPLITTFYLTQADNRTKKSLTFSYYCFERRYYFWLKTIFEKKNWLQQN